MASVYNVHSVLVVPDQLDSHGLLIDGPLGACPPMVWYIAAAKDVHPGEPDWFDDNRSAYQLHDSAADAWRTKRKALVVASNRLPVWQGWTVVELARNKGRDGSTVHALRCVLRYGTREALDHFRHRTCAGIGTVVYLDDLGMEVGGE